MRLVIVEDEPMVREGIAGMITRMDGNYTVIGMAGNIQTGYDIVLERRPDLVIVDLHIGRSMGERHGGGLELIRRLRRHRVTAGALILTNEGDFAYGREAQSLDINGFISKPVRLEELQRALERVKRRMPGQSQRPGAPSLSSLLLRYMSQIDLSEGRVQSREPKEKGRGLAEDEQIIPLLEKYHHLRTSDELQMLLIHLPVIDREAVQMRQRVFQGVSGPDEGGSVCTVSLPDEKNALVLSLDSSSDEVQKRIISSLCAHIHQPVIFARACGTLENMRETLSRMRGLCVWNLSMDRGEVITEEAVSSLRGQTAHLPASFTARAVRMLREHDAAGLRKCCMRLLAQMQKEAADAISVKEEIRRLCQALFAQAGAQKRGGEEGGSHAGKKEGAQRQTSTILHEMEKAIDEAVSWYELRESMRRFCQGILPAQTRHIPGPAHISEVTRRTVAIIQKEYAQDLSLQILAARLSVSQSFLNNLFKKEMRQSIDDMLRKRRVQKLCELLADDKIRPNEAGRRVGYDDVRQMTKAFREEMGLSPQDYRKQILQ